MAFPETRLTLIQRLATAENEEDWRSFLKDYWGPICRFALRFGAGNMDDAEDVARSLEIKSTDVVNFFRHTRQRLAEKLEERLRRQVQRYASPDEFEAEFAQEWQQLRQHLTQSGGLEQAIGRAYDLLDPIRLKEYQGPGLTRALERLTSIIRRTSESSGD